MTRPTTRFLGLDGLRGVAALSVVLFHAGGLTLAHGYLAVDMFFLLSGFVIALAHEERLAAGMGLARFLKVRARRLLPVFWLGASLNIAIFLWMASHGHYPGYGWAVVWIVIPLTTLLLLPAFGTPGDYFSLAMMNVSWSLFVEWLVNIAYAAGLFRLSTRRLAVLALAGWSVMAVAGFFTGLGWMVGINRYEVFTFGLLRGGPAFLVGVVLYRLHARGAMAKLPMIAPQLLLTFWLCIAAVPTLTATPAYDAVAVILLCPLLLALLVRAEAAAPAWFRPLGRLSYPLYTVHPGIVLLVHAMPGGFSAPLRALFAVGLSIVAAWLVAGAAEAMTSGSLRAKAFRLNPSA